MNTRAFRVALVVGFLTLASCVAAPYRTSTITFDDRTPPTLGTNPDEVVIAQATARLLRDRLGLPFPAETKVHLYVNQASFAEGLAREGGFTGDGAWDRASFAGGVASPRGLFLRGDVLASMRMLDRVALVTHELTHVSQLEMRRGGRGSPAIWLLEGHADWAKFHVVDYLGFRAFAESRNEVRRSVQRAGVQFFPPLTELRNNSQWITTRNRLGSAATYGQAFLAVDRLVERSGVEKLNEFQRRFATDADPTAHWLAVYGFSFREFAEDFKAYLTKLGT